MLTKNVTLIMGAVFLRKLELINLRVPQNENGNMKIRTTQQVIHNSEATREMLFKTFLKVDILAHYKIEASFHHFK